MNPELLIAELCSKLHSSAIDPHGPNLEADVRGIVMNHFFNQQVKDSGPWIAENEVEPPDSHD